MLSRSETPVFVTSTTLWSHVEKIAAIALELAELGYPVTFISGRIFEKHVTQLHPNITFEPMIGLNDQLTKEERAHYLSLPTPEEQEFYLFNKVFVDSIPYQFQTYQSLFKAFQEKYGDEKPLINFHDITTTGHHVVPLGGPGISPFANVGLNIHPLTLDSDDTFPFRTFQSVGRKPHTGPDAKAIHRKAYEDVKNEPMTKALNDHWQAKLKEMGVTRKQYPDICHAFNAIPDYLLSLGVPGFEFPRSDLRPNVRYFGAFKKVGNQGHEDKPHLPSWWDEVAQAKKDGKKIVAVSQGTVEINLDDLLLPTLEALQDREDILVVATSVVKEPEEVEGLVTPSNARVAKFIPYDLLLPMVDVLVSNGGYGAVQHALRIGVPMVVAGAGQDKAITNTLVEWTGAGINLESRKPGVQKIRNAVAAVLDNDGIKQKVSALSEEYGNYDLSKVLDQSVQDIVRDWEAKKRPQYKKAWLKHRTLGSKSH